MIILLEYTKFSYENIIACLEKWGSWPPGEHVYVKQTLRVCSIQHKFLVGKYFGYVRHITTTTAYSSFKQLKLLANCCALLYPIRNCTTQYNKNDRHILTVAYII